MEAIVLGTIGVFGAFMSGLLGIGGAVLLIPLLLYVPPLLGLGPYPMSQVTGMTIVQVLASSAVGLVLHGKKGYFSARVGVPMAIAAGIGALLGGLASGHFSERMLQLIFAILALVAAGLMVLPAAPAGDDSKDLPDGYNGVVAGALAGAVGLVSGVLGAGGAFLLVPLMRSVLHLSLRLIIGTSLAVVLASAATGTLGKALTGQVPWELTAWLVLGSLLGAPVGAWVSHRTPVKTLRWILAALIGLVGIRMLVQSWGMPPLKAGAPVKEGVIVKEVVMQGPMSSQELQAQLASDQAPVVLDVREPYEYAAGHIPGATHIPMGSLPARIQELPKDREIVVVCASGGRSGVVTQMLQGTGHNARNLSGGLAGWKGPIER